MPTTDNRQLLDRVRRDILGTRTMFHDYLKKREENWNFYGLRQWKQSEVDDHLDQNRFPYQINEVHRLVEHLTGTQIQTRLDVRFLARERTDEAVMQLADTINKWVEQVNDVDALESNMFREMLIAGWACSVNRWEMKDITYGYPVVEQVPNNEIFWDLSARKEDLSDCRWMARSMVMDRETAMVMFPDKADDIKKSPVTVLTSDLLTTPILDEHQEDVFYQTDIWYNEQNQDKINYLEYYEKRVKREWLVIDEIADNIQRFSSKQDAENYANGLLEGYAENKVVFDGVDGSLKVKIDSMLKDCIEQTIVIGDTVISNCILETPFFPYTVVFCYFNLGDFWGFVDYLKDFQRLINRSFSAWDELLGTSAKNPIKVQEHLLKKGWDLNRVVEEWSNTRPVIPVLRSDAIEEMQSPSVNPQLFNNIGFAIERMNERAGGMNALGLQQNAAESGRAVQARAEQGGIGKLPIHDKLKMWRKAITLKNLWYIKNFMPDRQIIRVLGEDSTDIEYVEVDTGILNTIKELQLDVEIEEAMKSNGTKQRAYQSLLELSQQAALPPAVLTSLLIELSPVPTKVKEQIKQGMDIASQLEQAQAEVAKYQKLMQEVETALTKQKLKEYQRSEEEIKAAQEDLELATREQLRDIERSKKRVTDAMKNAQEDIEFQQEMVQPKISSEINLADI